MFRKLIYFLNTKDYSAYWISSNSCRDSIILKGSIPGFCSSYTSSAHLKLNEKTVSLKPSNETFFRKTWMKFHPVGGSRVFGQKLRSFTCRCNRRCRWRCLRSETCSTRTGSLGRRSCRTRGWKLMQGFESSQKDATQPQPTTTTTTTTMSNFVIILVSEAQEKWFFLAF